MAVMRDWQDPLRHMAPANTPDVRTVIVPLDGGAAARVALPVAQLFARLEGATLHVAYVGEALSGPRQTLADLGLEAEEFRGAVLDQASGPPSASILRLAEELPSALIVMSTEAGGQSEEGPLGALAEAILTEAPARLVLVTSDAAEHPWQLRRVLLAHDGTPSADAAISPTANLAQRAGAEVIAMHVAARGSEAPDEPGSLPAPRYVDQPQHEWPAWAGEFVERMIALGAPTSSVNFKLLVTGGQPGSEIAQFARDHRIDLVVLPWHGNWEAQRSGAVNAVVRRSGCPVLLLCTAGVSSQ